MTSPFSAMKINKESLQKAFSDPNVYFGVRSIPHKVIQVFGKGRSSVVWSSEYDWNITIAGHGEEIKLTSDCPFPTKKEAIQCGIAVLGCLRARFEPIIR